MSAMDKIKAAAAAAKQAAGGAKPAEAVNEAAPPAAVANEAAPTQALATQAAPGPIQQYDEEVPDFIEVGSTAGTEGIGKDDLLMPRLTLAQPQTPLFLADQASGGTMRLGDMFNNLTNSVYGKGPIRVVIVRRDPPKWIEFHPMDEGGGVKDFDVAPGDERTEWRKDENGKSKKPIATEFYEYIALLPDFGEEMIALSFKNTGIKVAKQLNSLIKLFKTKVPIYARVYTLTSEITKNEKGTFAIWQVANAGLVKDGGLYARAKGIFESIKDKEFKIEREPGDDADEDFPTDEGGQRPNEM
jgi:hypothetical protein